MKFHHLVLGLTELYLEKVKKCRIREEMIHTMAEVKSKSIVHSQKELHSLRKCSVALLKLGLTMWKEKSSRLSERTSRVSERRSEKMKEE